MISLTANFMRLRWLAVLLLSLLWATMGSATALTERGDFGHCCIAAKRGGALADAAPGSYAFSDAFELGLKHDGLIRSLRVGDVAMPSGAASAKLMGELTRATGREVALLRLTDGSRVMRLGATGSVSGEGAARIIAHTHPSNILRLSTGDISTFWSTLPKQRSTVIVGGNGAGTLQHIPRNPWPSF
jgi:hypothetical protein